MSPLRFFYAFVLIALTLPTPLWASPVTTEDILRSFEERNKATAAYMEATTMFVLVGSDTGGGFGSGLVVADGYILSNGHVTGLMGESGRTIFVMNDRQEPVEAELIAVAYDPKRSDPPDLALLRYTPTVKTPVISFSNQGKRMDRVFAWGYPDLVISADENLSNILNDEYTGAPPVVYTEGTVNAITSNDGMQTMFHSARISGGNSGGPLVNSNGDVVGINTWTKSESATNVNIAQTTNLILEFLRANNITPIINTNNKHFRPNLYAQMLSVDSGDIEYQMAEAPQSPSTDANTPPSEFSMPSLAFLQTTDLLSQGQGTSDNGGASTSELMSLAKAGDPKAQYKLGMELVNTDVKAAQVWLEKSAKQSIYGKIGLAFSYLVDDDVQMSKAFHLFQEAFSNPQVATLTAELISPTDLDFYRSFYVMFLYDGEHIGIARDIDTCAVQAPLCSDSDADCKAYLATLLYYGEGIDANEKQAFTLAQEAVKEGSVTAKSLLGWMYYMGDVVDEDLKLAYTFAEQAAEGNDAAAQGLLAFLYHSGAGVDVDYVKAEGWARRSAEQANEFGQYILALLYLQGDVVEKNTGLALAYLTLSAEKGLVGAQEELEELEKTLSSTEKREAKKHIKAMRDEWKS